MKSNWKIQSFVDAIRRSKTVAVSLVLGLALGFAGSQAVQSSNEPTKESKKGISERSLGLTFGIGNPFSRTFFRDAFFNDLDSISGLPVFFENDWRPRPYNCMSSFRIDANETEKEITVKAEVPGIEEKDLDVTVSDNTLTIKGQRNREAGAQEKDSRREERFYRAFERSLTLPSRVESDKAEASLKNGILTIVIPKSQLAQNETRKLPIKTQ